MSQLTFYLTAGYSRRALLLSPSTKGKVKDIQEHKKDILIANWAEIMYVCIPRCSTCQISRYRYIYICKMWQRKWDVQINHILYHHHSTNFSLYSIPDTHKFMIRMVTAYVRILLSDETAGYMQQLCILNNIHMYVANYLTR